MNPLITHSRRQGYGAEPPPMEQSINQPMAKPTASANPLTAGASPQMFNLAPQRAEAPKVNPLLRGVASFAEGFAPEQVQAGRDRAIKSQEDASGREREQLGRMLNQAKAWTEKGLAIQDDTQMQQFFMQNADAIAQSTGQDIRKAISGGVNRAQLQQQLSGIEAMLQGLQGPGEPMSEYQKAQLAQKEAEMGKPQLFSTSKGIVSVADGKPELVYGTEADEKQQDLPPGMMWQDGEPVWIPGYKEGYREMHPGSAQGGNAPPSGYRWVSGADGQPALEKIPGGPADKPEVEYTPAQRDKLRKQAGALSSIQFAVDEYRDAVDKYGTRLIANPNDPDTAELEAAHTNLMMMLKSPEMFALGVLTGPDLDILEKSVTPPTGMKSFGANAETIKRRLGVLDRFIAQQRGQIPEQFIEQAAPDGQPQARGLQGIRNFAGGIQARQRLAQQPQQTDIDPEVEATINEAFGPDEDESGNDMTPEDWEELRQLEARFGGR